MTLLVNELLSEVVQKISSDSNAIVEGIRIHIYKHGNPAGSLYLQIRDLQNQVVAQSETIAISVISDAPFFHGMVRFFTNVYLAEGQSYQLVLCSEGYEFSESAYIGWCLDFDFHTYPRTSKQAHHFEVWARK